MTYYNREDLLGWTISILFKGKYSFFLGGINYDLVKQFNTYFNMLFAIIRDGIAKKATSIDLGQTAEIPKICLGGNVVEKNMLAYHKNRLLRIILKSGKRFLEYHRTVPDMHVFRKSI